MTTPATLGERALRYLGLTVVPVADRPELLVQVPDETIATDALIELGVIASDETPSAADQALALSKLRSVQASLAAQALVWWPDTNVPQAVAEEYTRLTAICAASAFGKPPGPTPAAALEQRIKRVALILAAPDVATKAILTVHYELAAVGRVRWSTYDIPVAAEDPYVSLAAAAMAPSFAGFCQPPPPSDAQMAYRQLARIIALPSSGERVMAEYF